MISIFEPKVLEGTNDILKEVFDKNWLGRGKQSSDFEDALSDFLQIGRGQLFTVASCTDAIFAAPKIFGLPSNGEIIVPANSFVAVGSAVVDAGLRPVIVDIDPLSGNISLPALAAAITPKTCAVFVTDYGGIPVDIPAVRDLVGPDIRIFHDCAGSLGTFINGQASGTLADYACWSFDPMKMITCGEGGAVYIKDLKIRRSARAFFFYGLAPDEQSGEDRMKKSRNWWTHQLENYGRRSMFTNINAAIGLPQLQQIAMFLARRAAIRAAYAEALKTMPGISLLSQDESGVEYSNYFCTLRTVLRDKLAFFLRDNGVYATFKYPPLHRIDLFKAFSKPCPRADQFSDEALNIPIHQYLSDGEVNKIIDLLSKFARNPP